MSCNYSNFPKESYSIWYKDEQVGIGLLPVFAAAFGAWNILWLSAATIEGLLTWSDDPLNFPCSIQAMPLAVATAMQIVDRSNGKTYGDLSLEMPPLSSFCP